MYVNDPKYRAEVDPLLTMLSNPKDLLDAFVKRQQLVDHRVKAYRRALARAKQTGYRADITDIWRGEHPDDTPIITMIRHDDNAYSIEGNWVPMDYPKAIWLMNLPIMEHALYSAYINYDLYGDLNSQIFSARIMFGLTRVDGELNFLRFLPRKVRRPMFHSWYMGPLSKERMAQEGIKPDDTIPTDIKYSTDDPKREFYDKVLAYMGTRVNANDPINRPKPGDDADRITKALRSIAAASKEQKPTWRKFKTFLPEAVFLRIDRSGQEPGIYTMTHNRDYATKAFITMNLEEDIPGNATVSILEGAYTSYPNFMFRISEDEIEQFASTLIAADTQKKFTAIVERWGIRRSSPDFWPVLNSVTAYVERTAPRRAGTFDVNRYKNL